MLAGAYAGYGVGSVLALGDPLILTAAKSCARSAAEWSRLAVDSVSVVVPVFLLLGILGGAVLYLLSRVSPRAYRGCLRCLPALLAATVFAYLGARLLQYRTSTTDAVVSASIALVVAAPGYLVLRLLLLRLTQGRLWLPVGLAIVVSLMLWVPVVAWLVLR